MFDKQQLFNERGPWCECGCMMFAQDAHHCLIPNLLRFKEFVNVPYNIVLVNHSQHIARLFDNQYYRKYFYQLNRKRYGDVMDEWVASLPSKLKHRLDFITKTGQMSL